MTAYEMCINNIAFTLFNRNPNMVNSSSPSAFDFSLGLAVGFCKDAQEVVMDIAAAVAKLQREEAA
ncbi:hypothetical protein B7N40_24295 [Salmonella enterica subsp. enterica serovar Bovismorbificans]|nr:hypothetical protein [Salmonella enterica subsp. enterica serovar Gatuni]EBW9290436.1 hypothetical protein [Salmonella enterica subsp. enterica serovar Bovismorbificans]